MSWTVMKHCEIIPCHHIQKDGFGTSDEAQRYADFMMNNRGVRNVGKLGNDGKCCLYYIVQQCHNPTIVE